MGSLDSMLLTFPPLAKTEFEFKNPHDFVPRPSNSTKKTLFKADRDVLPPLQAGACDIMSTPHRGLPPPAAMTLPDPGRIPPPMASHFQGMPAPPQQWQGAEDSMRSWLHTKAEEEKRKQEEERTRQESFRLEQRKIEQNMLSESIRNGVPPTLVPLIFAGLGGSTLNTLSIEWLQQYANSLNASQQQQYASQAQSQPSPDVRRERMINQSQAYSTPPQPPPPPGLPSMHVHPGQPSPAQPPAGVPYGYQGAMSPSGSRQASSVPGGPTSAPRAPLQNVLPRLTTNEMQSPAALQAQQAGPTHSAQDQSSSSPSIYFHHWVPPVSQAGSGNTPGTPSDYVSSPKKRKAQGAHQPPPVPTSAYDSPSFVHSNFPPPGRRGHARQRSDASSARGAHSTQSMGYSENSPAETEEQRQRQRQQYPVGGSGEDRSDSGSHSSYGGSSNRSKKPARPDSAPMSPRQKGGPVILSAASRVNSFGLGPGPGG